MNKHLYCLLILIIYFQYLYSQNSGNTFNLLHSSKNNSAEIKKKFANDSFFIKDDLMDLPLLLFESLTQKTDLFIIAMSGDGGWMDFTNTLCKESAKRGTTTIGFNPIPYFLDPKTPEKFAKDLQRIITNFSHVTNKNKVILIGYSFGAEVMPFALNKMSKEFQDKVIMIAIIAPSNLASLKVSPTYIYDPKEEIPLVPELQKTDKSKLYVFCDDSKHSVCNFIPNKSNFKLIRLNAGHNLNGDWSGTAKSILDRIGLKGP
jgi:type IV secretory pathway VirJ component